MEITPEVAHAIYTILVEHAGARDDAEDRRDFTFALSVGCFEYRFCGSLGFGGKFYVNAGRWYVGCYPEDRTAERDAAVAAANTALAGLRAAYVARVEAVACYA